MNYEAERMKDEKTGKELKPMRSMGASDGFYYTFKGSVPESKWMFAEPVKKSYMRADFITSDYDVTRNIYVVLKHEKVDREELKVRLIWMQP